VADFELAYGLRWMALRYFNAAGADAAAEIGEWHDPESHLIPRILKAAADSRRPVQVYGTDYPTADGSCIRDYIHVTDLARAHVLAVEHLLAGKPGGAFNPGQAGLLGSGGVRAAARSPAGSFRLKPRRVGRGCRGPDLRRTEKPGRYRLRSTTAAWKTLSPQHGSGTNASRS
jgi:UDP-glucose 4-epimerase